MYKMAQILVVFFFSLLLLSCNKEETTQPPSNKAPSAPGNPIPTHGTANVSRTPVLSWTCSDPDAGDSVKYDIYFGSVNPPNTRIAVDWSFPNYTVHALDTNKTYYWKITAKDSRGASSSGPVWRFSTAVGPTNQNLIAYYPFNNNTDDNSGNGNNGTPLNSPAFGTDRFNYTKSAIQLDGTDQYVSLPNSISIENDISISFWMKTDLSDEGSWPFATFIIDRDLCVATGDWSVGLGQGGKLQWNTGTNLVTSTQDVNNDTWMHIVVLKYAAGSIKKIYINGQMNASMVFSNEVFTNNSISIYVGASVCDTETHHYYKGLIDDIRIYDGVLSDSEILRLYFER